MSKQVPITEDAVIHALAQIGPSSTRRIAIHMGYRSANVKTKSACAKIRRVADRSPNIENIDTGWGAKIWAYASDHKIHRCEQRMRARQNRTERARKVLIALGFKIAANSYWDYGETAHFKNSRQAVIDLKNLIKLGGAA